MYDIIFIFFENLCTKSEHIDKMQKRVDLILVNLEIFN